MGPPTPHTWRACFSREGRLLLKMSRLQEGAHEEKLKLTVSDREVFPEEEQTVKTGEQTA